MKNRIRTNALLLAALLLVSMVGCGENRGSAQPADSVLDTVSVAPPSAAAAATEAVESPSTVVAAQAHTRTVTYLSDDGSIVKSESAPTGVQPVPPSSPELSNDHIFLNWAPVSNTADENLEMRPIYQSVSGISNVFAMPGAYGTSEDVVCLPLRLCGDVLVCGFDLTVEYNPKALSLLSVFDEDDAVLCNDGTPGLVRINYVSIDNTTADVDICTFKFRILADSGETPVTLAVKSVFAWDEAEELYIPDYQTMDGCIFVCS